MLSWLAKRMIARNMERASAGDIGPTLKMDVEDVRFRFPGDSSWGTELQGKEQLKPWLQRFADTGLQIGDCCATTRSTRTPRRADWIGRRPGSKIEPIGPRAGLPAG